MHRSIRGAAGLMAMVMPSSLSAIPRALSFNVKLAEYRPANDFITPSTPVAGIKENTWVVRAPMEG
jgi:hypothetical protein